MQSTQGSMLQSLRAVQAFLDQNAETLAAVVKTGARQQLADAIASLSRRALEARGAQLQVRRMRLLRAEIVGPRPSQS